MVEDVEPGLAGVRTWLIMKQRDLELELLEWMCLNHSEQGQSEGGEMERRHETSFGELGKEQSEMAWEWP